MSLLRIGVTAFVWVISSFGGVFDPGEWTRIGQPGSANLTAYGAGQFVTYIVEDQSFHVSADGTNWQAIASPVKSISIIKYIGGRFIAGGGRSGGTEIEPAYTAFVTSLDGLAWAFTTNSPGGGAVEGVAYGNGHFIARTEADHTFESVDGLQWTDTGRDVIADDGLARVGFGNDVFVGISGYTGQVFTSKDGRTWTGQLFAGLHDVLYGNGVFIGWKSGRVNVFSRNGMTWVAIDRPEKFSEVTFGNGRFFALTHPIPGMPRRLLSSYDGERWLELSTVPMEGPVATGLFAGNGLLLTSEFDTLTSANLTAVSPAFTSLTIEGRGEGVIVNLFGAPSSEYVLNERDENGQLITTPIRLSGSGTAAWPVLARRPAALFWVAGK
jgi:hypothetical protein